MSSSASAQHSSQLLSMDREFRYIVQWFAEWSEIQRDDFAPVLAECLACGEPVAAMRPVSGVLAAAAIDDKPLSLFQCRVKLFREWSAKWPADRRATLREKCTQIDADWGARFADALDAVANGHLAGDGDDGEPPRVPATNGVDAAPVAVAVAVAVVAVAEHGHDDAGDDVAADDDVGVDVAADRDDNLAANLAGVNIDNNNHNNNNAGAAVVVVGMSMQNGPVSA